MGGRKLLLLQRAQRRAEHPDRLPLLTFCGFFLVLVAAPLEHGLRELPLALGHPYAAGFGVDAAASDLGVDGQPLMFGPSADRSSRRSVQGSVDLWWWLWFRLRRWVRLRWWRRRYKGRRGSPVHAAGDGRPRLLKLRLRQ